MNNTVLELDDASVLKFSAVDESWPDSQVWYLKYRNGFINPSFMIISKKNDKALQHAKSKVEINKQEPTNESQQWIRDGLYILPLIKHLQDQPGIENMKVIKSTYVMATGEDHKLVLKSRDSDNTRYFEFQHIAVESYF